MLLLIGNHEFPVHNDGQEVKRRAGSEAGQKMLFNALRKILKQDSQFGNS